MKIMAVDLGKVRTGIAICDESEMLASPVTVIHEHNEERLLEKISQIISEQHPKLLVVGLPRNMDGSEGESAQRCRSFAEKLQNKTQLPVTLRDERGNDHYRTWLFLNATDTRGKKRKAVVDAVAATIILQDYLDFRRNQKILCSIKINTHLLFFRKQMGIYFFFVPINFRCTLWYRQSPIQYRL